MSGDLASLVERLDELTMVADARGIRIRVDDLEPAAVEGAMWSVLAAATRATGEERDELRDLANELGETAEALKANPQRPSDDELCRRYCARELSRPTIRKLTGWDRDRLWRECFERGLDPIGWDE